ncbi:MAG: lactonase family protein [Candidatus Acidiferrum sp.]
MKITRRVFAFLLVWCAPLLLFSSAQSSKKSTAKGQYLVYVGTYTTKTESKGIYAFQFDPATGKMTAPALAAESPDPSFVAVHPDGKYLYAVNEAGKNSMVSAFALDAASSKLTLLNRLPALGEDPCYISLDRSGKFVLIANYSSGNVAVFPILPDGKLGEHTAVVQDSGALGPNKERQDAPHAHWIEPSAHNRFVYVADLGLDRVLIYKFDAAKGTLTPGANSSPAAPLSVTLNPGTGPRHVAFSRDDNFMYVLGELQSNVTVFKNDAREAFRQVQQISALPAGFSGRNDAAEIAIHPSGKFLYTSNRDHESIAVFAIEPKTGTLTLVADVPTGGKEPRHFAMDPTGRYLLAGNQLSGNIVEFRIDPATGKLTATGEVLQVPSPVCVAFLFKH